MRDLVSEQQQTSGTHADKLKSMIEELASTRDRCRDLEASKERDEKELARYKTGGSYDAHFDQLSKQHETLKREFSREQR